MKKLLKTPDDVYALRLGDIVESEGKVYFVTRRNGYLLGVDEITTDGPKVAVSLDLRNKEASFTGRNYYDEMKSK
jgi:hypothetical protein